MPISRLDALKTAEQYTPQEARDKLREIATALTKPDGTVRRGVLSLEDNKDNTASLRSRSWFTRTKENTQHASDFIRALAARAAGPGTDKSNALANDIDRYLDISGNKFGSKSLVSLVARLDEQDAPTSGRLLFDSLNEAEQAEQTAFERQGVVDGADDIEDLRSHMTRRDTMLADDRQVQGRVGLNKSVASQMEPVKLARPKTVTQQIETLTTHLDKNKNTKEFFTNLLTLKQAEGQQIGNPPQFVMGDADGSLSRMLLMAIQSGHLTLNENGLQKLAETMNEECKAAGKNSSISFQGDTTLAKKFDLIMLQAEFHKPKDGSTLVFLGDIICDRFTNNQTAVAEFIQKAHANGAVFIKGNHDDANAAAQMLGKNEQFGSQCAVKLDTDPRKCMDKVNDLNNKYFVNAALVGNNFYSHNGIKFENGQIKTAFGTFTPANADALVKEMNQGTPSAQGFTDFRPHDSQMKQELKTMDNQPVRVVHGHNDSIAITDNVINLNARTGPDGKTLAAALVL